MKLDSIGDLFAKSWRLFEKHFRVALQIFLIPAFLILVGQLLIIRNTSASLLLSMVINLLSVIFSVVASIALITLFGKGTNFAESYKNGFKLFWPAVWIGILVTLATFGGFVLFVLPGIMLAIQLGLVNYALVLNGKQGLAALSQSREYIKGYWWAYFGRGILLGLVFGGVALVIFLPVKLLLGDVAGAVAYGILLLFITPFFGAYQFELFDNFRRLKPEVAKETTKPENGFLKVAMVLGIIAIVAAIILFFVAVVFLGAALFRGMNPNDYGHYPYTINGGTAVVIDPSSGPVGTQVTITLPENDAYQLNATDTILMNGYAAERSVPLTADATLTFTVPSSMGPDCAADQACPQVLLQVAPAVYTVQVANRDGTSRLLIDAGTFTVTTSTGAHDGGVSQL